MFRFRRISLIVPAVLGSGAVVVLAATSLAWESLDVLRWPLTAAGVLLLAALPLAFREAGDEEIRLGATLRRLERQRRRLKEERRQLERELRDQIHRLRRKEGLIHEKLALLAQWREIADPSLCLDAASDSTAKEAAPPAPPAGSDGGSLGERPAASGPPPFRPETMGADATRTATDKPDSPDAADLADLVESHTRRVLDRLRRRHYLDEEGFHADRVGEELLTLVLDVARLRRPDDPSPLLDVSAVELARSAHRATLQVLVLLEQLPLNLQDQSLRRLWETFQAGAKVYDLYRRVNPVLTGLRPVYYLGRMALGANPVTLGVGWALTELAKDGSRRLSENLAERYALFLLRDALLVVAAETRRLFDPRARITHPAWVHAAELADMTRRFPPSVPLVEAVLDRLARLPFECAYDRLHFYHCVASRKNADPDRLARRAGLSPEERRHVAEDLETVARKTVRASQSDLAAWARDVEERLGVRPRLEAAESGTADMTGAALEALSAFLVSRGKTGPDPLADLLAATATARRVKSPEARRDMVARVVAVPPPSGFVFPELEPDDPAMIPFLEDLAVLAARRPHDMSQAGDALLVREAAARYRHPRPERLTERYEKALRRELSRDLGKDSPLDETPEDLAPSLAGLLGLEEWPVFLYPEVVVEEFQAGDLQHEDWRVLEGTGPGWLAWTGHRFMALFPKPEKPGILDGDPVWEGQVAGEFAASLVPLPRSGFPGGDCRLIGGRWRMACPENRTVTRALRVRGPRTRRFGPYFAALAAALRPGDPSS